MAGRCDEEYAVNKLHRPGRCALCGKFEDHPIHDVVRPLKWWQRLARLAWPRWMWQRTKGGGSVAPHTHQKDSRDRVVAATDSMNLMRRRYGRK